LSQKRKQESGGVTAWAVMAGVVFGMGWLGSAWLRSQQQPKIELAPLPAKSSPAPKDEEGAPTPQSGWYNLLSKDEMMAKGFSSEASEAIIGRREARQGFDSVEEVISECRLTPEEARLAASLSGSSPREDESPKPLADGSGSRQ
jgi:hypothetical protein